jgi:hypothetical protein
MSKRFRAFRQFERFIFRGVPEIPEPIYEREVNGNTEERYTGKSGLPDNHNPEDQHQDKLIAIIHYNYESNEVNIDRISDESKVIKE